MIAIVAAAVVAFVDVNVIPMDRERVETHQTVLVRGDLIAAIGPTAAVTVPPDATVIDGRGRFLLPGLVDAHTHINTDIPWAPARDDFGDAPMYLAYGVTTVVNLSGGPTQLDWRRRVAAGELLGPTIYTSGPFINEPRFRTPDEVRREVARQAAAGYDLVKYHELMDTTVGLSPDAYRALNEAAAQSGMLLIGHAPNGLGLEALLDNRQSLAHVGNLSNIYFLPIGTHLGVAAASAIAIVLVLLTPFFRGRARRLSAGAGLASVIAVVSIAATLPGSPLGASTIVRVIATASTVALIAIAAALLVRRSAASLATAAAAAVLAAFWVPVMWRSSDSGIARLAGRVHDAGISVQSTLVVYETATTAGRNRLLTDPAIEFLHPDARRRWRSLPREGVPGNRLTAFNRRVVGALHHAGVPIMAGTDAMGIELIPPGSSLHRELELLTQSGLTAYEAIRAATVVPATFLRREREFGVVAAGQRADLLLVEANPLDRLSALKDPVGVMVRGRWLSRDDLRQRVTSLSSRS